MHPAELQNFPALRLYAPANGQASPVQVQRLSLGDLDPGDVVIRVAYSSLNYKDALAVTGAGKVIRRFPCVGGIDLAGEVLSSQDPRFVAGQNVLATGYGLGVGHDGGFARIARVPGDWLVSLPRELSLFDAMALGTAGFTAALALMRLEHMGLEASHGPVVVTGASGGVGSLAVGMLAQQGFDVVAVTGKRNREADLRRWGAKDVLARPNTQQAPSLAKAEWAAAIDNVGGATLPWLLGAIKPGGAVASVGNVGGGTFTASIYPFILRGIGLLGIDSANCESQLRAKIWAQLAGPLRPMFLQQITKTIGLEQVPAACHDLIQGKSFGRIVVRLDSDAP